MATSIATRRNLPLLCRRLQATTSFCLSTRAPEARTGISRMIDGALPRTLDKFQLSKFPHRCFMPRVGEDGTIKPKYFLAAPSTLFDSSGYFTGANCNGVFHFHYPDSRAHYLWNPTMNWLKPLPLSPDKICGISRSNVEDYAIWCDSNACQDYKVLLVVSDHKDEEDFELPFDAPDKMMQCFDDRSTYHLELYSSRTDSWRILYDLKTEFYSFPPSYGVCLDGVFYWPARSVDDVFLMSFDFATEAISTLPLPLQGLSRFERKYNNRYRVVEFKGLLGVFVSKVDEVIPSSFVHYVRVNGNWRLNYKFSTVGVKRPVCFSGNGEVLYFKSLNDELGMYNLATEEMKRLGVYCSSRPIELYPAS